MDKYRYDMDGWGCYLKETKALSVLHLDGGDDGLHDLTRGSGRVYQVLLYL